MKKLKVLDELESDNNNDKVEYLSVVIIEIKVKFHQY
jgi:hypothetical protein